MNEWMNESINQILINKIVNVLCKQYISERLYHFLQTDTQTAD